MGGCGKKALGCVCSSYELFTKLVALAGSGPVTYMQHRHVASSPCEIGLHKQQQCRHCCQQLSLCRSRIGWDAATVQSSKEGLCTLDGLVCR